MIILAHNEVANIDTTLSSVLGQRWDYGGQLVRVLVVSTASVDGTDGIVAARAARDERVVLTKIADRRGKVADVNTAVALTTARVLVIMDADITLSRQCIPLLLRQFGDPRVGMATPERAVGNPRHGMVNRIGHLAAELHNQVLCPKGGQIIAIDRGYAVVDERVTVDDAFQEWAVTRAGRRVVRVAGAVVHSRAPRTIREFISQRRRVHAQYLGLERVTGYRPVTRSLSALLAAVPRTPTMRVDRRIDIVVVGALVDALSRLLGRLDHVALRRDYAVWVAAESTKAHG